MMTVKDWLRSLVGIESRIWSKLEQIKKYRDLGTAITSATNSARVSGGKGGSRVELGAVGAADAGLAADDELIQLYRLRRDIMSVINAIADQRQRDVLEMHYVTGWTFQAIADAKGYDVRWAHVLHGMALASTRKILHEEKFSQLVHFYSLSDVV